MAESDDDRLRALRSRQGGGAYQEAPLPVAAQQKLAAAGAGRNIRGTGGNSGAGPSRAVAEPRVRKDSATGKSVINLNTAVEQDTAAETSKQSAASAKVHLDPRAPQSPLYNRSGPSSEPGKAGIGAETSSDREWEGQVKAVSSHISENHPHGGIGGVPVEYSKAGEPKPLSRDKITDLAERHLMGSARVPGLKAKSHEVAGAGERGTDQPGLKVNPAAAAQSNNALKSSGGPSSVNLTTGNEGVTPVPAKYKGKSKAPAKSAAAAPEIPVRQSRDFSGMTAKSSSESRAGRRLEKSAEYSENASEGQSRRGYYAANTTAANVTGSKTAQGVMHTERLSSPVNHGQFGKAAGNITQAVHSGLSTQVQPESSSPAGRTIKISEGVRANRGSSGSPEPSHQEKIDRRLEHGLITPDEHQVQSSGQLDHPLHPKSASVVQGSLVKDEISPGSKAVVHPAAVESSSQLGSTAQRAGSQGKVNMTGIDFDKPKLGKDITYFGASGGPKAPEDGKRGAPAYNTQQAYQKHIAGGGSPESYWQERDTKKTSPKASKAAVAPAPEVPKSDTKAPAAPPVPVTVAPVQKTPAKAPEAAPAPKAEPKIAPKASNRRPVAPQSAPSSFPTSSDLDRNEASHLARKTPVLGLPSVGSGAGASSQNPQTGSRLLSQAAVRPTLSDSGTAKTVPLESGKAAARSRSPRGSEPGNVPSPVAQSGQFGGEHHYHFHGNVNMGAGTQINGNVGEGASVSGGVEHGAPMRSPGTTGGSRGPRGSGGSSGRTGNRAGGTHMPVTGSPTGLQKLAYGAIHTSVNGHSIAGGVEHITGGGHLGMNDSQGRPIGHPHDDYVRHHPANHGVHQGHLQDSQFGKARASRQQAAPE